VVTEWGREISEADLPLFTERVQRPTKSLLTLGTCDYNEHRGSQGLALRCRYNKIGIGFVTFANLITYLTNVEGFV
jgi:hypothetical protein